jgi:hypothetical protein
MRLWTAESGFESLPPSQARLPSLEFSLSAVCEEGPAKHGLRDSGTPADLESQETGAPQELGWCSVLGKASSEEVEELDRIVSEELERIDLDSWR